MNRRLILPVSAAALLMGVAAIAVGQERLARLNVEETHLSAEQAHNMSQLARLLSVLEQLRRDPPPALRAPASTLSMILSGRSQCSGIAASSARWTSQRASNRSRLRINSIIRSCCVTAPASAHLFSVR